MLAFIYNPITLRIGYFHNKLIIAADIYARADMITQINQFFYFTLKHIVDTSFGRVDHNSFGAQRHGSSVADVANIDF